LGGKVYINGRICSTQEATVSVLDHGLLYGDGVFEGIRAYGGRPFRLEAHLQRLYESAHAIALEVPLSREEMAQAVRQTLQAAGPEAGYVRLIVTRGTGDLGLDPFKCKDPQVIIIADRIALYPPELYERGLDTVTVSTVRNHPNAVSPRIKSLNYLNNTLAKIEALRAGCTEAIMLNKDGYVAECTGDNIFIVKGRDVLTPPEHAGILAGVTRRIVLELAPAAGLRAAEKDLTRFDLYVADECFVTGTAAEIVPVVRIDGRAIGSGRPGPATLRLREMFRELISKEGE
jgi:branched-chain amino acid aminotransferase